MLPKSPVVEVASTGDDSPYKSEPRRTRISPGLLLIALGVVIFAAMARPVIAPGYLPGGDADEYVHLAKSLLHGSVLVDYDGLLRLTRYTPGFSIILVPAVALGGLEAAVWVCYL